MAKRVQHVRHNTAGADAFTGLIGEITADIDKKELRYHDGATAGGIPAARADFNNVAAATVAAKLANTAIANFLSTGIDDNASAERIDITNALISLLTSVSITGNLDLSGTMNSGTVPWARLSGVPSYQPLDAMLTALAALATSANQGLYFSGADTPALYTLTSFMRNLSAANSSGGVRQVIAAALQTPAAAGTAGWSPEDLVELNVASGSAVNTVAAGTAHVGWFQFWKNIGAYGNYVVVTGNGANIDGEASFRLYGGHAVILWYDGTQFRKIGNPGGGLMIVRDQKTSGTQGGTFTSGAWRTRDLNTVAINEIAGASLASNRVTLPAGTYYLRGSAPATNTNAHQLRIRNITAGADLIIGHNAFNNNSGGNTTHAFAEGVVTLAVATEIELQHICAVSAATVGLGTAGGFGTEVYSVLTIQKLL